MGARIGYSSAESTSWISDSAVSGMCISALRHSVMTVVTAGIRDGSTTQSISFDVFFMARNSSGTASYSKTQEQFSRNFPLKGSVHTITTSAGVRGLTITQCLRGGETALESSGWTSESSVLCRLSTGFMGSHRLVISVATKADSATQLFSFDSAQLSRVACRNVTYWTVANGPATGSTSICIVGSSMSSSHSVRARVSSSAAEASAWISTSSIQCMRVQGTAASSSMIVTSGYQPGTLSVAISFDSPVLLPANNIVAGNRPSTGYVPVSLSRGLFSTSSSSEQARIGQTSCEASPWTSVTSICCKTSRGRGASLQVSISTGALLASASHAISYDLPIIHKMLASNCPAIGVCLIEVLGSGFGSIDFTPTARLGRTGCISTPWTSESSLKCRIPRGTGKLNSIISTIQGRVGSVSLSFSYDLPFLIANSLQHSIAGELTETEATHLESTGGNESVGSKKKKRA